MQAHHIIHKRLFDKLLCTSRYPINLCPSTTVCVCWAHNMYNLLPGFQDVCHNSMHTILAYRLLSLQQSPRSFSVPLH